MIAFSRLIGTAMTEFAGTVTILLANITLPIVYINLEIMVSSAYRFLHNGKVSFHCFTSMTTCLRLKIFHPTRILLTM